MAVANTSLDDGVCICWMRGSVYSNWWAGNIGLRIGTLILQALFFLPSHNLLDTFIIIFFPVTSKMAYKVTALTLKQGNSFTLD